MSAPTSGCPTAMEARWASRGRIISSASRISPELAEGRDAQYAIDAGDEVERRTHLGRPADEQGGRARRGGDRVFAPGFRHVLGRACRIGARRDKLADATLRSYAARLDKSLDELMARTPTNEEGIKLQRAIKKCRRHLFVFVTNHDLPATNNASEQALRPAVTFRKITNGFRTEWGARHYADIRSIIETARRRAIGALEAIRLTLAGKLLPTPA